MSTSTSILTKFRTAFLLIAILPVIVFGVVSYVQMRITTVRDKERELITVAESRKANLETWISDLRHRSSSLRQIPEFIRLIPQLAGTERPKKGLRHQVTESAEDLLDRAISTRLSSKEDYNGVYLIAPGGELLYALVKDPSLRGRNLSGEEFFAKGKEKDFFSEVTTSPLSKARCFFFSSPLHDESGRLLGVLVLEANLDRILKIFNVHTDMGETGSLMLMNRDGDVLFDNRFGTSRAHVTTDLAFRSLQGNPMSGVYDNAEGVSVIGAFVPYNEVGFIIGVEVHLSEALRSSHLMLYVNIVGVLLIAILVFIISRFFANRFAGPIISMTRTAALVAEGDLRETVRLTTNDEVGTLGTSFNTMVQSLAGINRRIQEMASEIGLAANEILASTEEQEQISLQQSAAVSETSATIEELSVAARQVAQSAQSIMKQVEGTASKIMFLSQKAQEIDKISTVIEEVAQQIHLLSLNASIEAARAGEHGKGFGVVATEIRKLSEKSNKQTAEIAHIVEDIQNAISSVVLATEQAVNGVRSITISVQEQDAATDQIAHSMQEINVGMKQSIEGTKQTVTSVEQLKRVMVRMNEYVRQFKVD